MSKAKLEYIWLDGYKPTQSLRSKTMVVSDFGGTLEDCKVWSFDGSSTMSMPLAAGSFGIDFVAFFGEFIRAGDAPLIDLTSISSPSSTLIFCDYFLLASVGSGLCFEPAAASFMRGMAGMLA